MNNREWLQSLATTDVHALNEWFDSEHVENQNGILDGARTALDAKSVDCTDSREKLEADIDAYLDREYGIIPGIVAMIPGWLDRQAAITERGHAVDNLAIEELRRQRDELQSDNALLLDANARLQRSLAEASEEREAYREAFSKALGYADDIATIYVDVESGRS